MGDIIGHKDRQICLPSHVLQDLMFDHSNKNKKSVMNHHQHHGNGGFRRRAGSRAPPPRETFPLNYITREKQQSNWRMSNVENRMQAFFLVSAGRTASGTGVFLPATAFHPPTKKPACSPVLLPSRVAQALNLNVHGIHISPPSEIKESDLKKTSEMVVPPKKNIEVESPIDSPEKLLPDEWVY